MKKKWIKLGLKIIGIAIIVLILIASFFIYRFTTPKTDQAIIDKFVNTDLQPTLDYVYYNNKKVRLIKMQKEIDTSLTTLILVHGSPGSLMDFKRYLKNIELNKRANIIAYDRIGYGNNNIGEVLNSVEKEVDVLHKIIEDLDSEKIVLVGYSYGGTIVMASPKKYKKKIILAAAVRGDLEPIFWLLNVYKWDFTRPLIPKTIQAAAQEKLKHVIELPNYENQWNISDSNVLSIHGTTDRIVPFQNSLFLERILDKDKFKLLPIEEGNHALIWNQFDLINSELLKSLDD
jgi:pimeloyl-ACP methyl ester carboxylesterase